MVSLKRNRQLFIDAEAHSTLALVQEGLLSPVEGLMNEQEALEINKSKMYKGVPYPFAFILAPAGRKNEEILNTTHKGEVLDLINCNKVIGQLTVNSTFKINLEQRLVCMFGTSDSSHPNVAKTKERLGKIAVEGEYRVDYPLISGHIKKIKNAIEDNHANNIAGIMMAANPLNRAQERLIRQILDKSDMLIIFLLKPFDNNMLRFDIRYESVMSFIENFLPANRVMVVPLENTYIFSGYNELLLDALVAKNYGCTSLVVSKNHAGLGLFYDANRLNSIFDASEEIKLEVSTVDQYVYCDKCRTLVSSSICPHGQHHHIHYHSTSILKLLKEGMMPPSVLVRREVSASILSTLFPDRFEHLQELYDALVPNEGIIEEHSEEDFYIKLMGLYQTTSLT